MPQKRHQRGPDLEQRSASSLKLIETAFRPSAVDARLRNLQLGVKGLHCFLDIFGSDQPGVGKDVDIGVKGGAVCPGRDGFGNRLSVGDNKLGAEFSGCFRKGGKVRWGNMRDLDPGDSLYLLDFIELMAHL